MSLHNRDIRLMGLARRIAVDNVNNFRFKLGAVLTIKKDIISVGQNLMRTHPFQKKFGRNSESIYLHAEIAAISNALNHVNKNDLRNATLYVHRVKRSSNVKNAPWVDGMACPCAGCQSAIIAFGIRRVIFSTDVNEQYEEWMA